MFNNFVSLEKSLDFIESLENKKFAEDEKMKLLKKMNEMQKHIENLENSLISKNDMITHLLDKNAVMKKKNINDNDSNFSNTRVMDEKNMDLYNIDEYGYADQDEEFEQNEHGIMIDKNSSDLQKR